eukprot:CAMPEP_0116847792 /NCGR_PEP_ID=MMETSP0418-20121206/14629_1 /TAXON_ID=1158023 /ORGANISM="Astrosyne radiata, Strain 13vi08-1A" /LENGTH=102 /DNA_ID=CAMNT_0004479273 /DNA_START=109 /DNA_END=414 /DNA_ORIENTATION=-
METNNNDNNSNNNGTKTSSSNDKQPSKPRRPSGIIAPGDLKGLETLRQDSGRIMARSPSTRESKLPSPKTRVESPTKTTTNVETTTEGALSTKKGAFQADLW